jgi:hypothetical protein
MHFVVPSTRCIHLTPLPPNSFVTQRPSETALSSERQGALCLRPPAQRARWRRTRQRGSFATKLRRKLQRCGLATKLWPAFLCQSSCVFLERQRQNTDTPATQRPCPVSGTPYTLRSARAPLCLLDCARSSFLLSLRLALASWAASKAAHGQGPEGTERRRTPCAAPYPCGVFVSSCSCCPLWLAPVCRFALLFCASAPQAEQRGASKGEGGCSVLAPVALLQGS